MPVANPVDSRRIRREIARKYESDPRNWHLLWGIDEKGHYNFLVGKNSTLWWLKEELINPLLSVGCGIRSRLEEDPERKIFSNNESNPSFGLRPVPDEQLKKIISDLAIGRTPKMAIQQILSSEPKPLRELGTPFFMQGPLYHMPQITDVLSDKQRELNAKLDTELERLVTRRYPQLEMSYT
jgi:hypothetical protein